MGRKIVLIVAIIAFILGIVLGPVISLVAYIPSVTKIQGSITDEFTLTPAVTITKTLTSTATDIQTLYLQSTYTATQNLTSTVTAIQASLDIITHSLTEEKTITQTETTTITTTSTKPATTISPKRTRTETGHQTETTNTGIVKVSNWDGDACTMPNHSIHLTSSGAVYYNSSTPLAGFQFDVEGASVTGAAGGDAKDAGFSMFKGNDRVIGFSLKAATVSGCGTLVILDLSGTPTGLSGIIISNSDGEAISFSQLLE